MVHHWQLNSVVVLAEAQRALTAAAKTVEDQFEVAKTSGWAMGRSHKAWVPEAACQDTEADHDYNWCVDHQELEVADRLEQAPVVSPRWSTSQDSRSI